MKQITLLFLAVTISLTVLSQTTHCRMVMVPIEQCCICNWQDVLDNGDTATGHYATIYESSINPSNRSKFGYEGFYSLYGYNTVLDMGYAPLTPGVSHVRLLTPVGDTMVQMEAADATVRIADMSGSGFKTIFHSGPLTGYRDLTSDNRSGQIALAGDGIPPTAAIGPAAGAGFIVSVIGDDRSGIIRLTTGPGAIAGLLCTVFFTQPFSSPVRVVPFPASGPTSGFFYGRTIWTGSGFTNNFTMNTGPLSTPLPAGITLELGYIVQK